LLRTLHLFLARELAKVTLMSLVAFTLVMTVFAIIEPMRKQGLSSDQVISFLGYTLPMMLSLTLPIAALFAATIVYGRLSQDNEVLACRAGGIATLTLLEPALALGILVTAASLWLTNSVTPYLAQRAQLAVQGNIKAIVQYQLRKQGYVRYLGNILHADSVEETRDGLVLNGVVLVIAKGPKDAGAPPPKDPNAPASKDPNAPAPKDPNASQISNLKSQIPEAASVHGVWDVMVVTADRADATFQEVDGEAFVGIQMESPIVSRSTQFNIEREDSHPIDAMPLKTDVRDDPGWYTWGDLVETLKYPARNAGIQQKLRTLWADVGHEKLVTEVIDAIQAGKPYELQGPVGRVEISAPFAEKRPLEANLVAGVDSAGRRQPVVVRIIGPLEVRVLEADHCRLTVTRSPLKNEKNASLASLDLDGDVRVRTGPAGPSVSRPASMSRPADAPEDWTRRGSAHVGDLEMPPSVTQYLSTHVDPNQMLENITGISHDPVVIGRAQGIVGYDIASLRGHILAEMHGRLAYGLSCFLMVAMGSALGLVYRGGQLLSAFVLAMVPATIVIVMIVMGKQMLGNPKLPSIYGMSAVWGGIAALVAGNLGLYGYLARR